MKIKFIPTLVLSAVVLATGCSSNYYTENNFNRPTNALSAEQAQTDARILGGIITLNKNEIAAAQEAQRKSNNLSVKNYANRMYLEHSNNLQQTEMLARKLGIVPEQGAAALMLQRHGQQELAMLDHLNQRNFDRAYINQMVKDHSAALQLINHKLLKQASHPLLIQQLENTRAHVQSHLQQAKLIQKELAHH